MKRMLVNTGYSSPDGHEYIKCRRCEKEFYIVEAYIKGVIHNKPVSYCPFCSQKSVLWNCNEESEE